MGPFEPNKFEPLNQGASVRDLRNGAEIPVISANQNDEIPFDVIHSIYGSNAFQGSNGSNFAVSAIDTLLRNAVSMISQRQSIDEQRRYNSPAAQVQRLKEAGINPYSVLGNIASNNTGDRRPSLQAQDLDFLERAQRLELQDAQIANIKQQNRVVKRNADILDMRYSREYATFHDSIANILTGFEKVRLQNALTNGKITYQEYANELKRLNKLFEEDMMSTPDWMIDAANNSDTYRDFVNNLPPKYAQIMASFGNTLASMNYTDTRASREAIAAEYENRMGMPFNNMSDLAVVLHLLNAFMPRLFDKGKAEVKRTLGIE